MKQKDFKNLRSKDIKSLLKMAQEKRAEITKKRVEVFGGKDKNLKAVSILRRELAKILTLVREKEIIRTLEEKGGNTQEPKK